MFKNNSKISVGYFAIQGGEVLDVPKISAPVGSLMMSTNYELDLMGRPRRVQGYEAYDGHPSPSEASYWILSFSSGNAALADGTTITGATSTNTGDVIDQVLESGTYAGGNAAGYFVLTNVTGDFTIGENLQVAAVTKAVAVDIGDEQAAEEADHSGYLIEAMEYARDQISAVPGSGDILGFNQYNGVKVAFRNNSGGTAAIMYKSSTSGWVACDLGKTLAFTSGGTYEISEDDDIEGETGGATATVKRIILTSGTWAGGDAAGILILYDQTGTFESETIKVGANLNVATIATDSTAVTLNPSGRYKFVIHNFYASSGTTRLYGCDGQNKAFEWDGSTFVQITTGATTDTPQYIGVFRNHLFLSYANGSLQQSTIGVPYPWLTGTAEYGAGSDIVGLSVVPGPLLAIHTENGVDLLSGTSIDDFEYIADTQDTGGKAHSVQRLGTSIFLNNSGIMSLTAVQEYGDFKSTALSRNIESYLASLIDSLVDSVVVRSKSQYRLYFDDLTGIIMTIDNGKIVGFTRTYYPDQMTCCYSTENTSGGEELFFGCDDGFVYQLDKGNNFNGEAIRAFIKPHYNHFSSPTTQKRFRKIVLEADAPVGTEITAAVHFDYGSTINDEQEFDILSAGGVLGIDAIGTFVLGGPDAGTTDLKISGSGKNMTVTFISESTYVDPHTIQGMIVHYDKRGLKR